MIPEINKRYLVRMHRNVPEVVERGTCVEVLEHSAIMRMDDFGDEILFPHTDVLFEEKKKPSFWRRMLRWFTKSACV